MVVRNSRYLKGSYSDEKGIGEVRFTSEQIGMISHPSARKNSGLFK